MSTHPGVPRILSWSSTGLMTAVHPDLAKGGDQHRPLRPLAGWATTWAKLDANDAIVTTRDRHKQTMDAAAEVGKLDWSAYVDHGVWNDTHTSALVGVPTYLEWVANAKHPLAKSHRKLGFFTAGHLWDRKDPDSWRLYAPPRPDADGNVTAGGVQLEPTEEELRKADRFWDLAMRFMELGRPLGFSVQGKMLLSPCEGRIVRAWVTSNAVCELPVNPDATAEPILAMLKAETSPSVLDVLRPKMIGKPPCGRCTCPGGVCFVGGLPLAKAGVTTDGIGSAAGEDVEGDGEFDADTLSSQRERIADLIVERWGVTRAVALRWINDATANLTSDRGSDPKPRSPDGTDRPSLPR